jgi:hypothetical protein
MTDQLDRLTAALADRYRIERELGSGGMACRADRRSGGPADCFYG